MQDMFVGLALVLVIEGLLLFALPRRVFTVLKVIANFSEKKIRLIGITSITIGVVLLCLIRL